MCIFCENFSHVFISRCSVLVLNVNCDRGVTGAIKVFFN
jgi:hypothetical protein